MMRTKLSFTTDKASSWNFWTSKREGMPYFNYRQAFDDELNERDSFEEEDFGKIYLKPNVSS